MSEETNSKTRNIDELISNISIFIQQKIARHWDNSQEKVVRVVRNSCKLNFLTIVHDATSRLQNLKDEAGREHSLQWLFIINLLSICQCAQHAGNRDNGMTLAFVELMV